MQQIIKTKADSALAERLPPLNAMRAFEAAARHLSFMRAAEELHVTPAAISHQIKALQDYLGVQIFRRLNRALALIDARKKEMTGRVRRPQSTALPRAAPNAPPLAHAG